MPTSVVRSRHYRRALRAPVVWTRATKLGLAVGFIQVSLNQGDHWLRGEIDAAVILKTILCPLLSFAVAFISALATHAESLARSSASSS